MPQPVQKPSHDWLNADPIKRIPPFLWKHSQDIAGRSHSHEDKRFLRAKSKLQALKTFDQDLRSEKQWREHHEAQRIKHWKSLSK